MSRANRCAESRQRARCRGNGKRRSKRFPLLGQGGVARSAGVVRCLPHYHPAAFGGTPPRRGGEKEKDHYGVRRLRSPRLQRSPPRPFLPPPFRVHPALPPRGL